MGPLNERPVRSDTHLSLTHPAQQCHHVGMRFRFVDSVAEVLEGDAGWRSPVQAYPPTRIPDYRGPDAAPTDNHLQRVSERLRIPA